MSYHKVNYKANGVDFADYFPAYEVYTTTNIASLSLNSQFSIPLSKNKYNTLNYVSFIQPFFSGTQDVHAVSRDINPFTIYNKTTSSYSVWMNCENTLTNVNIVLWCVTFYMEETEQSLMTNIPGYKVNNSDYDPADYFPQFLVHQNTSTTIGDVSITNSLSTKNTSSTNYFNFGSVTNNSVSSSNAANVQQIIYYEETKASSQYIMRVYTTTPSITLNTITMYVPSIPSNNFVSNCKVNNVALEDTLPICEVISVVIGGSTDNRIWDVPLSKNTNSTTNYVVITSFSYYHPGNTNIYNPYEASINAGMPIISSKTALQFRLSHRTTSGDSWNGGLNCLVIYI